jgi:hypothetical protein
LKPYKFRVRSTGRKVEVQKAKPNKTIAPALTVGMINGVKAGSAEEWRISLSLTKMKKDFVYQYPILGGRIAGGQILDFLVYTPPLPTPVMVQGTYWHGGTKSAQTEYNMAAVDNFFAGQARPAVAVWDYQLANQDLSDAWVKGNL